MMVGDKYHTVVRELRDGIAPVIDFVYPPRCPVCSAATLDQGGLCAECWGALEIPGEPACARCQAPFDSNQGGPDCATCIQTPPLHDGITAATVYNDVSRQLVLSLKHGRRMSLAKVMGRLIAARLPLGSEVPLLIPVPLHRWRIWKRGFNQAALIASELSRLGKGELLVDGLERVRQTPSLGGMGASQRDATLSGAVRVSEKRRVRIAERAVVLIDDVLTSGATSRECVRALKDGGAASVRIACFARVLGDRD